MTQTTTAGLAVEPLAAHDESGLRAWFELVAAAGAVDVPEDPPPCWRAHRVALSHPWPGDESSAWLARSGGEVVGAATLDLPMLDNLDNAVAGIVVSPSHRRAGVGRALLARVTEFARERGRARLIGDLREADDGTSAGAAFAGAHGFAKVLAEQRRRLAVPVSDEVGPARLAASARAAATGYSLVRWTGATPPEYVADIARLTGRMNLDAPLDDLRWGAEHYDAARIRAREAAMDARGMRVVVTAAVDDATGRAVAFTELAVLATVDWYADQGDTIVAEPHRGHRLGTLIKLANLELLRSAHPGVRVVDTWNADSNRYMVSVNEAIGFRPYDHWGAWQREL
jgi:GNAT superfamily N-acetyltransferase